MHNGKGEELKMRFFKPVILPIEAWDGLSFLILLMFQIPRLQWIHLTQIWQKILSDEYVQPFWASLLKTLLFFWFDSIIGN